MNEEQSNNEEASEVAGDKQHMRTGIVLRETKKGFADEKRNEDDCKVNKQRRSACK
jgi:hypothetical protein